MAKKNGEDNGGKGKKKITAKTIFFWIVGDIRGAMKRDQDLYGEVHFLIKKMNGDESNQQQLLDSLNKTALPALIKEVNFLFNKGFGKNADRAYFSDVADNTDFPTAARVKAARSILKNLRRARDVKRNSVTEQDRTNARGKLATAQNAAYRVGEAARQTMAYAEAQAACDRAKGAKDLWYEVGQLRYATFLYWKAVNVVRGREKDIKSLRKPVVAPAAQAEPEMVAA